MIDIKNKKCVYPKCKKQPTFNYENKTPSLYCKEHALENMVDIRHKKCIYPNCKTRPSYAYPNNSPSHCAVHRLFKYD